ncbi:MAG: glycosyltransferase family 2 protein [Bacilli bacterium]|jgi:glycosyltransferase involved in cell wall biosynthesis
MEEILVSILTATFNRAHLLRETLTSVQNQSYRNIEYIILDDESTDNTKEVVEIFAKSVPFPVRYIYHKKCYKHGAMNILFAEARGRYAVMVDDDDTLLPDAIKDLVSIFKSLPNKNDYASVVGRATINTTGEMEGELYPDDINEKPWKRSLKMARKISGDKLSLMNLDIYKNYCIPTPEGVSFVTESVLWNEVLSQYREYYTNIVVLNCTRHAGYHLSAPTKNYQYFLNWYFYSLYMLNNKEKYPLFKIDRSFQRLNYAAFTCRVKKEDKEKFGELKYKSDRFLIALLMPIMFFVQLIKYGKRQD